MASRTLLIVDDSPTFRTFARRLLTAEGFDVVGDAWDGASAVAAAVQLRPDVVLLDISLPDTSGFEVCEMLRATDPVPSVVLTSSRDVSTYRRRLSASTARGFLPKRSLSGAALSALLG